MKLKYPYNPSNPITSLEEYEKQRQMASRKMDWREFNRSVPHVLISRCPHCEHETWMEAGMLFTLTSVEWFQKWNDGRLGVSLACKHLFCVDGALNLSGNEPTEARPWHSSMQGDYIWMASEVPFIKPRVLALPTMCAVIHQLPVAGGKYTAYPIVYFAKQQPDVTDYCIAWAAERHIGNCPSGFLIHGKRSDAQDYKLDKWIRRGSLFWLDMEDGELPLTCDVAKFPYKDASGRRHPYIIRNGEVHDLPPRQRQGEAEYFFEHDSQI
jgi:hypothetical protein